jgi:D-threo-aldose 1-dehydrogenase
MGVAGRMPSPGLLPACQQRGVVVLAAGIFNSGILADPRPGATYDYAPAPDGLVERVNADGVSLTAH